MQVQPYLFFNGRCDEATELYRKALGAEVNFVMRFSESPDAAPPGMTPANWDDKVMHSEVRIGESVVMMSDGCTTEAVKHEGFSLSVTARDEADADRIFAALGEGGSVGMPLAKTFFSPRFGMVTDKFGVSWMVIVPQEM